MKLQDKLLLAATFLVIVFAFIGVTIWTHPQQYTAFLFALGDIGRQIWVGIQILFFTALGLGVLGVLVHFKREHNLVRPNRHGQVQAIQTRRETVVLSANPVQPIDEHAQMERLFKTMISMQKAYTGSTRLLDNQQRFYDDDLPLLKSPEKEIPQLPTNVRYEEIRDQVPRGHVLVGCGLDGIETKDKAVGACMWIVGLAGTGKTSTTVTRVEERSTDGHKFLGVDPHWFKPDSLTNAVAAYGSQFIAPIARNAEEAKTVLTMFLTEFNGRKSGQVPQPWQKITLLVDEVGALMDATTAEEESVAKMLPSIARICGQEARNFNMGGIFISQQATNLAWLRKVALMVIVHQLLQDNEKKLATNNDRDAMEEMKSWPIGRTYVYGVGFQEGPRTVQQPYFEREVPTSKSAEVPTSNKPNNITYFTPPYKPFEVLEDILTPDAAHAQKNEPENKDMERVARVASMMADGKSVNFMIAQEWGISKPGGAYQSAVTELREVQRVIARRAIAG